jgi:hypothetical protein
MEVSGELHAPAALPPEKEPPVSIGQEAGWAPKPVWTLWTREKSYRKAITYLSADRRVWRTGGMMIRIGKPKKLIEKRFPVPLNPPRNSHEAIRD